MRNAVWIYRLLAVVALTAGAARGANIAYESLPAIDPPLRALEDGPVAEAHVFLLDATRTFYDMPGYSSLFGIECTPERDNRLAYNITAQWPVICLAGLGWQPVTDGAEVVIVYGRYEHIKVEPAPRSDDDSPRTAWRAPSREPGLAGQDRAWAEGSARVRPLRAGRVRI